ncbi:hypothetical protein Tco_0506597 [Tanacetum coccineum]
MFHMPGVGSIMYVVRCTRPDVAFAQNITSRFQQNLGDLHWTTVKNILKYLRNTKDMFLVYEGGSKNERIKVLATTDAWISDGCCKSQTGYVFVLNGGVVDWKSAKQSIFATSSAEAEYIAAFDASKEAVWVRKFISGEDKKGASTSQSGKDTTKSYAMDVDVEDETDEMLGGFIVDDEEKFEEDEDDE